MSDRGITFSAPMVRALLEGRKTQTRRLIQPIRGEVRPGDIIVSWPADAVVRTGLTFRPPHQPGDRLYVREHWKVDAEFDPFAPSEIADLPFFDGAVSYLATAPAESLRDPVWGRHRQAMHMPRWASRLWLLVTDVRVQRLQDISEGDARREGLERRMDWCPQYRGSPDLPWRSEFPIDAFHDLWDSLHAEPGTRWEDNPWIYAVSFEVKLGNIDAGDA